VPEARHADAHHDLSGGERRPRVPGGTGGDAEALELHAQQPRAQGHLLDTHGAVEGVGKGSLDAIAGERRPISADHQPGARDDDHHDDEHDSESPEDETTT
jgi:hypothetical protein